MKSLAFDVFIIKSGQEWYF